MIPPGAFSNIQDDVQDGRQNVNTKFYIFDEMFITVFCPSKHIVNDSQSKSDPYKWMKTSRWPPSAVKIGKTTLNCLKFHNLTMILVFIPCF